MKARYVGNIVAYSSCGKPRMRDRKDFGREDRIARIGVSVEYDPIYMAQTCT